MVAMDREHETKKRKHNAILGKNFFVSSTHRGGINRSVVKNRPRRRPIPLLNGLPPPEASDVVDWSQVHSTEEIIENENENVVLLSRILEVDPRSRRNTRVASSSL